MPKNITVHLPKSFWMNGRRYFKRSEIEHLKKVLIAQATGLTPPSYAAPEVEQFVASHKFRAELGVAKRTWARRISESDEIHGVTQRMPPVRGKQDNHNSMGFQVSA